MHYMVIENFLNESWLDFTRAEVRKYKNKLSRAGYNNQRTMRDSLDPRYAETSIIPNANILAKIWDKFLWNTQIEEDMTNADDSALVHATYTRFGRTLLSSYGNNDGYGMHVDVELDCITTCVLMLTLGSKPGFEGGDFQLGDKQIDFKNNRLIIFPSCRMHGVSNVNMIEQDVYENRRFTLQYFISSVTPRKRFPDEGHNL